VSGNVFFITSLTLGCIGQATPIVYKALSDSCYRTASEGKGSSQIFQQFPVKISSKLNCVVVMLDTLVLEVEASKSS